METIRKIKNSYMNLKLKICCVSYVNNEYKLLLVPKFVFYSVRSTIPPIFKYLDLKKRFSSLKKKKRN